jgi:hypothetical protein
MRLTLLLAPLAAGCAIPPPPPSPDPIGGGERLEGRLDTSASPAQAAFCVSQGVPLSRVVLLSDGAAVRPAPGARGAEEPDYALTVRRSDDGATWLRQVGGGEATRTAVAAHRLDDALAACAPVSGDGR